MNASKHDIEKNQSPNTNKIVIGDILRFIDNHERLQRDKRIGNSELSSGLRLLANVLRPYKSKPIAKLAELQLEYNNKLPRRAKKLKVELPSDLSALSCEKVSQILSNEKYLKKQLVELGTRRFGIPRSKLNRLPRPRTIETIRAALNHERSLQAISEQAKRAGQQRSA